MTLGSQPFQAILDWLSQPHPLSPDTLLHPPGNLTDDSWLLALRIFAGTLLRRGPSAVAKDGFSFGDFFATCQRLVDLGQLPIFFLKQVRGQLANLERQQIDEGFLPPRATAWWYPLPQPTRVEDVWSHWILGMDDRWRDASFDTIKPLTSITQGAVLPITSLAELFRRLEQSFASGELNLQREGVGRSGSISEARGDQVQYFSGREPWLIKEFPELACLIQHMAGDLGHRLARGLGKSGVRCPQRAMLARYSTPNQGYRRHLDNPGGSEDNGRSLTAIFYLNPPSHPVRGGNLNLWPSLDQAANGDNDPPQSVAVSPGTLIAFDSRSIPHEVTPILAGSPRWALSFWFNDRAPIRPSLPNSVPLPSMTELMIHQEKAPVPANRLWFHCFDSPDPRGSIVAPIKVKANVKVGIVATTYGAGKRLEHWCAHHLSQGAHHLFLVFDQLEDPSERQQATRLAEHFPQLTILAGQTLSREQWPGVPDAARVYHDGNLAEIALQGNHSSAVCARQTLNASYVLTSIQQGRVTSVDWLIHIDDDEFLCCLGPARGGVNLSTSLATAEAQGNSLVRFLNHELLLPRKHGQAARYKLNPRLAAAKLGSRGWQAMVDHLGMSQAGTRPYFSGYHNGKSGVQIKAGLAAAGVHGWTLHPRAAARRTVTVAGPVVLHAHCLDEDLFCRKYMRKSQHQAQATQLFRPSPLEEAALTTLEKAASLSEDQQREALRRLYRSHLHFSPTEIDWLTDAGLLLQLKNSPIIEE